MSTWICLTRIAKIWYIFLSCLAHAYKFKRICYSLFFNYWNYEQNSIHSAHCNPNLVASADTNCLAPRSSLHADGIHAPSHRACAAHRWWVMSRGYPSLDLNPGKDGHPCTYRCTHISVWPISTTSRIHCVTRVCGRSSMELRRNFCAIGFHHPTPHITQ